MSSSDDDTRDQEPTAPVEVLYFRVATVSLPLNFCVLLNPIMIHALHLPESGSALLRGPKGAIVPVKALPDPECPQKDVLVPYPVQLSLRAAVGDTIPMMALTREEDCTAIQIQPLFEGCDKSVQEEVSKYFESDARPVAPGSFFAIGDKMFKILNCLPTERCIASSSTKIYYKDPPSPIEEDSVLPIHFSDLILSRSVKELMRNGVWLPLHNREVFETLNMPTSVGVLVTGGEGNGKTSFLSAVWLLLGVPSLFVDLSRIKADDVEKKLKEVFSFVEGKEKCALFLDNIHCITKKFTSLKFSNERRKLAKFFAMLDRAMANPGVAVIASAISTSQLDESLIRPGRFSFVVDLETPDATQRADIIRLATRGLVLHSEDLDVLATRVTTKMTRGEIQSMCRKAVNRMVNPESSGVAYPTDGLIVFSKNMQLMLNHFTSGMKIDYDMVQEPLDAPQEPPTFEAPPPDNPFGDRGAAARGFPRRKNEAGFDLSGIAPGGMRRQPNEDPVFHPRQNWR